MFKKLRSYLQKKPTPSKARSRTTDFFASLGYGNSGFKGGQTDRITESWQPGSVGPNRMHQMDGRLLRERAWDLYRNNPFAQSAIESYVANVIEAGIKPKPQINSRAIRSLWMDAYLHWAGLDPCLKREADITGISTIDELSQEWLREIIVGGGCITHYIERPRKGRSIPLALELIGEERFAQDRLWSGRNKKTANPIVNGVEIDSVTGSHVAYHVLQTDPNDLHIDHSLDPIRLSAEFAEYSYFRRRNNAHRGHTLLHSVVIWLWALGYYTDNELKNSDVKSNWAYMIKTSMDAGDEWDFEGMRDSQPESGTTDIYGNKIDKLQGQMIFRGAPGDEIEAVGPNVPPGDTLPWLTFIQRSIAIGTNQSYEEVSRDYSKGSFSSIRASMNADRKRYKPLQRYAINHFVNPTWVRFVEHASRQGLNGFPHPTELQRNYQQYMKLRHQTPGWESVKPSEDAKRDEMKLNNNTTTLQDVVGSAGGDWEETLEQAALEKKRMEELDITPTHQGFDPAQAASGNNPPDSSEEDDE